MNDPNPWRRKRKPTSVIRRLLPPILLLVVVGVPYLKWDEFTSSFGLDVLGSSLPVAYRLLGVAIWLVLSLVVIRLINVALWDGVIERRFRWTVPKLLRDLFALSIVVTAVAIIIKVVFGKSLTIFVAFTGGAGFIVGLAVQKMIGDLFAGIVINLEQPFKIGEEVRLTDMWDNRLQGTVADITWRSTTFIDSVTAQRVRLPNNQVIDQRITSWAMGGQAFMSPMLFHFDYDVPVDRACRVLAAAATEAQEELDERRKPQLDISEVDDFGYGVRVRYWLREATRADDQRRLVHAMQRHMRISGIRPRPADGSIRQEPLDPAEHRLSLLRAVDLLTALNAEELTWLADHMDEREYAEGDAIIERGAIGESMFIVSEGIVDVFIANEDDTEETRVNRMGPGQFFGELSLLTGEPRTATILAQTSALLYEITKSDVRELLTRRPELAEELARIVARHRIRSERKLRDLSGGDHANEVRNLGAKILSKLTSFFGL